jgi:streptogramin lyase
MKNKIRVILGTVLFLSVLAAGCGKITTTSTSTASTVATLPTTTGDYYWNPKPLLYDITSGPNRNLWFTDYNANQICKISSQTGIITGYDIPTTVADPTAITAGPDGNLWFTEWRNKIGKISPTTGTITEYPIGN